MLNPKLKIGNLILLIIIIGLSSCASTTPLKKKSYKSLNERIEGSPIFSKIFTGFALYNPELEAMLYEHQADKYYTPASNTKIFTLYTTLKVLGDSLPLFRYHQRPGFVLLQGTGNPLFRHPDFDLDTFFFKPLRQITDEIYYSGDNYKEGRFGPGWSWADYAYSYQAEKSPFPIYGNCVRLEGDTSSSGFHVYPTELRGGFYFDIALNKYDFPQVRRDEQKNSFAYNEAANTGDYFKFDRPMHEFDKKVPSFLSNELGVKVRSHFMAPQDSNLAFKTLWMPMPDTLLRKFMQSSDNFIGEQLLLACSAKLFNGELSSTKVIDYAKKELLADLPDEPRWADGSGLSRYNLFTPRSIVSLLNKLHKEYPQDWLFETFPNGGKSGTIKNWYPGSKGDPYVFAKTGTLSNKHCLSGYIKTHSGKVLIFSFMNNNYVGSSAPVKREMQAILEWIRDNL